MSGRKGARRSWILCLALAACSGDLDPNAVDAQRIEISVQNSGETPISCLLRYGHWVDRDLGSIAPEGKVAFFVSQDAGDGALYVLRDDGMRRMMIETIQCGLAGNWQATFGQVDLDPARRARPGKIGAQCQANGRGGRVQCAPIQLQPF